MKDDQRLIREYLAGNNTSFEVLYNRHNEMLFRFTYHLTGKKQDAEDVCQSVWIEAIQSIQSYTGKGSFKAWLHGIALNLYKNQRRKPRIDTDPLNEETLAHTIQPDASQIVERVDTERSIRAALASLDEAHREIVILHELQGLKYREIAAMLQCPIGTVRSRLHYAIAALRAALSQTSSVTEASHEMRNCPAES